MFGPGKRGAKLGELANGYWARRLPGGLEALARAGRFCDQPFTGDAESRSCGKIPTRSGDGSAGGKTKVIGVRRIPGLFCCPFCVDQFRSGWSRLGATRRPPRTFGGGVAYDDGEPPPPLPPPQHPPPPPHPGDCAFHFPGGVNRTFELLRLFRRLGRFRLDDVFQSVGQ